MPLHTELINGLLKISSILGDINLFYQENSEDTLYIS